MKGVLSGAEIRAEIGLKYFVVSKDVAEHTVVTVTRSKQSTRKTHWTTPSKNMAQVWFRYSTSDDFTLRVEFPLVRLSQAIYKLKEIERFKDLKGSKTK